MDFVKMEGLGNDFIVVDGPVEPSAEQIRSWCDRRFGVGADGVLEVTPVSPRRIRMRYWNKDGGEAEMCGNGLRCLARLASDRGWLEGADLVVETAAGDMPASVQSDGQVQALVGVPRAGVDAFEVDGMAVHPVVVGNPHAVVFVDDPEEAAVESVGAALERHGAFPGGANVEFVRVEAADTIKMRIWERGVGETLGSGTGAAAAAFAARVYRDAGDRIDVSLPGGKLTIDFKGDEAWMTGPGNEVFRGTLP